MRSTIDLLLQSVNKISEINKEKAQIDNKFTDNTRSMTNSLLQSVNKISEINKKISQIYKEELKNKIIISESDKKTSQATLIKKIS